MLINARLRRTDRVSRSPTCSFRPEAARRERLLSGALIVLKFGDSALGTSADPARYGALQATMASGRVRLATDGGAKIAR